MAQEKFPDADQYLRNLSWDFDPPPDPTKEYLDRMPKRTPKRTPKMKALPDYLELEGVDFTTWLSKQPREEQEKLWLRHGDYQSRKRQQKWEELPDVDKLMDVVSYIPDLFDAPVAAAGTMFQKKFGKDALTDPRLRKAAADWLSKARSTVLKKGTELGDFFRKEMDLGGKDPAMFLYGGQTSKLADASVRGHFIDFPGSLLDDPAAAMHVLGHEGGHVFQKRLKRVANEVGHPSQQKALDILETFERTAGMGGFREPSGVMGPAVAAAKQNVPGASIPDIQRLAASGKKGLEQVRKRSRAGMPHQSYLPNIPKEYPSYVSHPGEAYRIGSGKMDERTADLFSELLTQKGQSNLTDAQRWEIMNVTKLY